MSYAPAPVVCHSACPAPLCCSQPDGIFCYLIERGQPEGLPSPQWWSWRLGGSWVSDPFLASRYPDALLAAAAVRDNGLGLAHGARAVQHIFGGRPEQV